MKKIRFLRYSIYGFLLMCYISPINGLAIDWLKVSQWLTQSFFRSGNWWVDSPFASLLRGSPVKSFKSP